MKALKKIASVFKSITYMLLGGSVVYLIIRELHFWLQISIGMSFAIWMIAETTRASTIIGRKWKAKFEKIIVAMVEIQTTMRGMTQKSKKE